MYKKEKDRTASEYRAIALEHKESLETNKRIFVKSGLYVVIIAIILIIISIAWFVMNNRVDAVTSTVSALGSRYAIVTGDGEDQPGWWERVSSWINGDKPFEFDLSDSMNVKEDSNFKNMNSTSTLSPGSSGKLVFTVDPIAKDLNTIEVTLDLNIELRNSSDGDKTKLEQITKGHILFFEQKTSDGKHYEKWIKPSSEDGKYRFVIPKDLFQDSNGETTKSVEKTVYWVWPQQFHNLVYTGDGVYYKNLFKNSEAEGYSDIIKDINTCKGKYFWTIPGNNNITKPEDYDILTDMTDAMYQTCTDEYNNADQNIGNRIKYVQVRFNTSEVEDRQ